MLKESGRETIFFSKFGSSKVVKQKNGTNRRKIGKGNE